MRRKLPKIDPTDAMEQPVKLVLVSAGPGMAQPALDERDSALAEAMTIYKP